LLFFPFLFSKVLGDNYLSQLSTQLFMKRFTDRFSEKRKEKEKEKATTKTLELMLTTVTLRNAQKIEHHIKNTKRRLFC